MPGSSHVARFRSWVVVHGRSRLSLGLALVHAILFLLIIFSETPLPPPRDEPCPPMGPGEACIDLWDSAIVAGRDFHHNRAFLWLVLLELPAEVATYGLEQLLTLAGVKFSRSASTYVSAWLWFAFGAIQWWVLGTFVTAARDRRRRNAAMPAPTALPRE